MKNPSHVSTAVDKWEDKRKRRNEILPKNDKVSKKIRKLLGVTAQTFIPELCQALKENWFQLYQKAKYRRISY